MMETTINKITKLIVYTINFVISQVYSIYN
jgi:hypothetical protein